MAALCLCLGLYFYLYPMTFHRLEQWIDPHRVQSIARHLDLWTVRPLVR